MDGVWIARNKITFDKKNLQVVEVIKATNQSYHNFISSMNTNDQDDNHGRKIDRRVLINEIKEKHNQ